MGRGRHAVNAIIALRADLTGMANSCLHNPSFGWRLALLALVHLVSGCLLAWLVYTVAKFDDPCLIGLLALIIADAGMLGLWSAVGTFRSSCRLSATAVWIGWLIALVCAACSLSKSEFPVLVPQSPGTVSIGYRQLWPGGHAASLFLVVALTALSIFVIGRWRFGRGGARLGPLTTEPTACEGFRFTIRQLLMMTAVVAIILAIGRATRPFSGQRWAGGLAVAVFTPCFVFVTLAMVWAALGSGRPSPRLAIALPAACVAGMVPSYCLGGLPAAGWTDFIVFWSATMGLQAAITAGSLVIVRSVGWRLVRG